MDNIRLFNGAVGTILTEVNKGEDPDFDKVMDMTVDEMANFLVDNIKKLPKYIRRMKVTTVLDLAMSFGDLTEEEVDDLLKEDDEG